MSGGRKKGLLYPEIDTEQNSKERRSMKKYEVWTDGGCNPNPGDGGYGAIILVDGKVSFQVIGGEPKTTNNRMEFLCAIRALEYIPDGSSVRIYSDSQLLCKIANGTYKAKKNKDLCEKLFKQMKAKSVEFNWIRGHSGNLLNNRCDTLASWSIKYTNKRQQSWGSALEFQSPISIDRLPSGLFE
jgi:ribonuclease HI